MSRRRHSVFSRRRTVNSVGFSSDRARASLSNFPQRIEYYYYYYWNALEEHSHTQCNADDATMQCNAYYATHTHTTTTPTTTIGWLADPRAASRPGGHMCCLSVANAYMEIVRA